VQICGRCSGHCISSFFCAGGCAAQATSNTVKIKAFIIRDIFISPLTISEDKINKF
jgi:predicted NodU family carbamoyl transferase